MYNLFDNNMKKKTKIILFSSIGIVLIGGIVGCAIYLNTYYKAVDIDKYMESDNKVTITKTDDYYFFDNVNNDKEALIFYPGGKVDTLAYSPLLNIISHYGVDCYLLEMPFHLAIFNQNAADKVINNTSYTKYYLSGHSLGGVMAASYTSINIDKIDGLFLLASYPSKELTSDDLVVYSLYGSLDGVLNKEKYEEAKKYMPSKYYEYIIEGGNHGNFGSYGKQDGDNDATISNTEQWNITATYMNLLRLSCI